MEKITELLSAEVVNASGKRLGFVVDLRSEGEPEHGVTNKSRRITEIVYTSRRVLWFFGSQSADLNIVPWTSVKKYSRKRIVIDTANTK